MNPSKELIEAVGIAIKEKFDESPTKWNWEDCAQSAIAVVMQSKEVRELVKFAKTAESNRNVPDHLRSLAYDALQPFTDKRG